MFPDVAINRMVTEALENQSNNNLYNSDSVMIAEETYSKQSNGHLCCTR